MPNQSKNELKMKVIGLEKRLKRLEDTQKLMVEVVDNHGNILLTSSTAVNLICSKLGIKDEEVFTALANTVKEIAERKRNQPEGTQSSDPSDLGKSGPELSNQQVDGNDSGSSDVPLSEGVGSEAENSNNSSGSGSGTPDRESTEEAKNPEIPETTAERSDTAEG